MSLLRSFLHISRIFQSLDLLLHEAFFSLHTFPLEPQKALPNLLTQRECLPTTPVNKTLLFKTSEEPQIHLLLSRLCFWAAIEFHNIRTNSACCWKWNVPHTNAQSQLLAKNHESSECGGKRRENFNKWDQTQINSQIHQGGCGRETKTGKGGQFSTAKQKVIELCAFALERCSHCLKLDCVRGIKNVS